MDFNSHLLPPAEGRPAPELVGIGGAYAPRAGIGSYSVHIEGKPELNTTEVISSVDEGSVLLTGIVHTCHNLLPEEDLTIFLTDLEALDDLDDRNTWKWRNRNPKWHEETSPQYRALMLRVVRERTHRRLMFVADDGNRTKYATFLAEYELRKALIERDNA
jgi:hypothetical protein